jgi:hypothetical protein
MTISLEGRTEVIARDDAEQAALLDTAVSELGD